MKPSALLLCTNHLCFMFDNVTALTKTGMLKFELLGRALGPLADGDTRCTRRLTHVWRPYTLVGIKNLIVSRFSIKLDQHADSTPEEPALVLMNRWTFIKHLRVQC